MHRMRAVRALRRMLRQSWPWLVGIAIVAVIVTRVPFAAFRAGLSRGPHVWLALADLAIVTVVLATDTSSTWLGLVAAHIRWPIRRVLAIRGATYALALLNYAVGQASLGYYLYRGGESRPRAVGVTLFLSGTTFATLLVLTTVAWGQQGAEAAHGAMWWTLVGGCAAFAVYLVIIALAPRFVVRIAILSPLFDAGLRGHALAVLGRLPHVTAMILAYWVAMRVWVLAIPFGVAAVLMPAVMIATVLPISPAGLGTAQAAMVAFFSDYAPGATADDRAASILAFGVVHFVYSSICQLAIGALFLGVHKRQRAALDAAEAATATPPPA